MKPKTIQRQANTTAQSTISNLSLIFKQANIPTHDLTVLTLYSSSDGSFALKAEDIAGFVYTCNGNLKNNKPILSNLRPDYSKYQSKSNFLVATKNSLESSKKQIFDFASKQKNPLSFIQLSEQTSSTLILDYNKKQSYSLSGGVDAISAHKFPLKNNSYRHKPLDPDEVEIISDFEQTPKPPSPNSSFIDLWRMTLDLASPISSPFFIADYNGGQTTLKAYSNKPTDQRADKLTITYSPSYAISLRPEQRRFQFSIDGSYTLLDNRVQSDEALNSMFKSIQQKFGGDLDSQHLISTLPQSSKTNNHNYSLIDENFTDFETYFRRRYNDSDVDSYLYEKELYQQNKIKDNDNCSSAIQEFISNYINDIQNGEVPVSDLVLLSDGGDQYSRLDFDKSNKTWSWIFDSDAFENDKRLVTDFHRQYPDAKIHLVYADPESVDSETHPLDPPTNLKSISELAKISGGTVCRFSEISRFEKTLKTKEPLVLIPQNLKLVLEAKPIFFNAFFSAEFGSKDYFTPNLDYSSIPTFHLGDTINIHTLLYGGKTSYPHLDDDRDNRIDETVPTVGKGLLPFLGIKDPELEKNIKPFTHLLDSYSGLNNVDPWSESISDYLISSNPSPDEKISAIRSNFDLNLSDIRTEVWGGSEPDFSIFGLTGKNLNALSDHLSKTKYYCNLLNYDHGPKTNAFIKNTYQDLTDITLPHYTNLFSDTKSKVNLYESMLWNTLHSLTNIDGSASNYLKLFYHVGETASNLKTTENKQGRHPRFTIWAGAALNQHLDILNEEEMYFQLKDFFGSYAGLIYNLPISRSETLPIDATFDIAFGLLMPTTDDAGLEFISLDLLGRDYVGKMPLSESAFLGSFRASLNGAFIPESKSYEFDWTVRIDGLPTSLTLSAKDAFSNRSTKDKILNIDPELDTHIPPNTIGAKFRLPIWNKLNHVTGALIDGFFQSQIVNDGIAIKNIGVKTSITPHKYLPSINLSYERKGFTGLNSDVIKAGLQKDIFGIDASLDYTSKSYPGKSLDYLIFNLKYSL